MLIVSFFLLFFVSTLVASSVQHNFAMANTIQYVLNSDVFQTDVRNATTTVAHKVCVWVGAGIEAFGGVFHTYLVHQPCLAQFAKVAIHRAQTYVGDFTRTSW